MDIVFDILRIVFTNHEVLQGLSLVIGAMLIWLLKQLLAWIGIKIREDRIAALNRAVDKAMTYAVVKTEDMIRDRGWDSVETRSEILARAAPVLENKFAETLKANGIDMSDPECRRLIREQMERMFPDVATRAAASPATPGSVAVPVAVVLPPSPPGTTADDLNREELERIRAQMETPR